MLNVAKLGAPKSVLESQDFTVFAGMDRNAWWVESPSVFGRAQPCCARISFASYSY